MKNHAAGKTTVVGGLAPEKAGQDPIKHSKKMTHGYEHTTNSN